MCLVSTCFRETKRLHFTREIEELSPTAGSVRGLFQSNALAWRDQSHLKKGNHRLSSRILAVFFCSVYTLSSNFTSLKRVFKKKKKSLYLGCFLFKNVLWWWQQWPSKSQMFLEQLYSFNVWVLIFSEKVLPCFIGNSRFCFKTVRTPQSSESLQEGGEKWKGDISMIF